MAATLGGSAGGLLLMGWAGATTTTNAISTLGAAAFSIDGRRGGLTGVVGRRRKMVISAEAESGSTDVGAAGKVAIVAGLVANPIVAWSLYTLKTTGCGLPPGPGGSLGALEGVSYLALVAIISWSLYTKSKTGSGLPPGPFGLLGAVEGLSYLCAVSIVAVFALQYLDYGYIPGPTPGEQCFG